MNRRAYGIGLFYVFLTMAASVVVRSYAEAAFLNAYGVAYLPHFYIASSLAFIGVAAGYHTLHARVPGLALDGALIVLLGGAAALSPWAMGAGGRGAALFVVALTLIGLSSVANLAAWNAIANSVAGRTARRALPRAGAGVTAGGVAAGFGGKAIITNYGLLQLPSVAVALAVAMLGCAIAIARVLKSGGAPGAPPANMTPRPLAGDPWRMVRWLIAAAVIQTMAATLIEFQFNSGLKAAYPPARIAELIALFYGVTSAVLLVLQLLAVPVMLVTRSLPFTVSLHPTFVFIGVGALLFHPAFVVIAGARTLENVFRSASAGPGQELSLSVLGPAERPRWKLLLRGVMAPLGAAAAGAILLVALPAIRARPRILIFGELGLCVVWLAVMRRAAAAFVVTLAAPLGVKRKLGNERTTPLNLDQLLELIERSGDPDPVTARLARALLVRTGRRSDELAPHLTHEDPAVRAALFMLAARRPHPSATAELRAAVEFEDNDTALALGLQALAAHGDAGAAARARGLAADQSPLGQAAEAYLAELGLLDVDETRRAVERTLAWNGAWAAAIAQAEPNRDKLTRGIDALVTGPMTSTEPAIRRQAYRCALAADPAFAARWPMRLDDAELRFAIARSEHLQPLPAALPDVATGHLVAAARVLRSSPSVQAMSILERLVESPERAVSEAAARSLVRRARERGDQPDRETVERAVHRELDQLELYLGARAPAGTRTPFHEAELARQTRRCLARLLTLVALDGDASTIDAAARRLASRVDATRRRALDLLQEVSRSRPRLLQLVERYLGAPTDPPAATATAAVEAFDSYLKDLWGGQLAALAPRIEVLRQSVIYDDLPGDEIAELARRTSELRVAVGELAVQQGVTGVEMYHVLSGALAVERGGAEVGRITAGQSFGELSLIDDAPRQVSLRALEATLLVCVSRAELETALARSPHVGLGLLRSLTQWLHVPEPAQPSKVAPPDSGTLTR